MQIFRLFMMVVVFWGLAGCSGSDTSSTKVASRGGSGLIRKSPVKSAGKSDGVKAGTEAGTKTGVKTKSAIKSAELKLYKVAPVVKIPYKTVATGNGGKGKLYLYIFAPAGRKLSKPLPAIVFFFGGGWVSGSPRQFFPQCKYLAGHGMVAISAQYRTKRSHNVTPFACVADGKSAIRYVRKHASEMGVDTQEIIAGGGSAGGHVAACTAVIRGHESEGEDLSISSVPDALVLMNPVIDTTKRGYGMSVLKGHETELSPCQHVHSNLPPTIIFHGTADTTVPFENVKRFCNLMHKYGNVCELYPFKGRNHGFFNAHSFRTRNTNKDFLRTMRLTVSFLRKYGFLM